MKKVTVALSVLVVLFAVVFTAGCITDDSEPTELLVATTTSLFDTGLLDAVQDYYLEEYNVNLLFT
ncbi:MAG: tungsten ABC transporter substrate-binding protein, partial [Methanocorpusculaceae archaeon]|nr:tungsten ABC transporter substrate-binding protein [Methanocorpusculaceae archaeon]